MIAVGKLCWYFYFSCQKCFQLNQWYMVNYKWIFNKNVSYKVEKFFGHYRYYVFLEHIFTMYLVASIF